MANCFKSVQVCFKQPGVAEEGPERLISFGIIVLVKGMRAARLPALRQEWVGWKQAVVTEHSF